MKFVKHFCLFALLAVLAFASCKKDEIIDTEIETPVVNPSHQHVNGLLTRSNANDDGLELGCVSIDYPFEMLLADSVTTIEVTSEDDFITALSDSTNYPIDFVYPLNVTTDDGLNVTVNNVEELAGLFADCIPGTGWGNDDWFFPAWIINFDNSCYQLVYPVNLLNTDSTTVTANDESELISLLSDGNIYSFAFPLNLEGEDGNPATADDAEDLFDLLADCGPGYGGGCGIGTFACYQLDYPATMLLIDGSTAVVNNDDEFAALMMSGEWAGFGFPLTLIDADGNEITVNNEQELNDALLACGPSWGGGNPGGGVIEIFFGCYSLGYPATVQLIDGTTAVVNDDDELVATLTTGTWAGFGFPLTLIDEDGNEITVNNEQELADALEDCENFGGGGPGFDEGDFFCYNFSYPVSVTESFSGNTVTFNNAGEWQAYHENPFAEPFDFVFPLTLVDEDGNAVTVEDQEELTEAIQDCW